MVMGSPDGRMRPSLRPGRLSAAHCDLPDLEFASHERVYVYSLGQDISTSFMWREWRHATLYEFAIRFVDHFLIPGVVGDGVEESCKRLGLHLSRITRFASMIDIDRHVVPDAASRASMRAEKGIAADTIVISLICRLAPEKGIDIALEAISLAFSELSPGVCERIRIIIAGDGPLRIEARPREIAARRGGFCDSPGRQRPGLCRCGDGREGARWLHAHAMGG